MTQKLKKLFSSISILFFLFFTGCMVRQNNPQYTIPYSYNPYYKKAPKQRVYKNTPKHYKIESTPKKRYIIPRYSIKRESTFDKILRESKIKKLKPKKIKYNNCNEEFPSNVPRGSVQ